MPKELPTVYLPTMADGQEIVVDGGRTVAGLESFH